MFMEGGPTGRAKRMRGPGPVRSRKRERKLNDAYQAINKGLGSPESTEALMRRVLSRMGSSPR
jgi:chorismate mutase